MEPENSLPCSLEFTTSLCPEPDEHSLRPCVTIRDKLFFHGEELLTPRPTPKLENHPLSAVHDCLLNIFAAALHILNPFSPPATYWRARRRDNGPTWRGASEPNTASYCYHLLVLFLTTTNYSYSYITHEYAVNHKHFEAWNSYLKFISYVTKNACISITKNNQLMMVRKIIFVYSEDDTKPNKYILCAKCKVFYV
jgi:hypothetical protein